MRSEYPGVRLQQLFTRDITHREMINLIRQLPPGSRLDRAIRGEAADWTIDSYLLRAATNALIAANHQRAGKRAPESAFVSAPKDDNAPVARKDKSDGGAAELDRMFSQ